MASVITATLGLIFIAGVIPFVVIYCIGPDAFSPKPTGPIELNFTPLTAWLGGLVIGLAALTQMAVAGLTLGFSGVVRGVVVPLTRLRLPEAYRPMLIAGLVCCGLIAPAVFPTEIIVFDSWPPSYTYWRAAVGGFQVGLGTSMGGGCTSGHGVCGLARLSPRSFLAVAAFMFSAFVTATLTGTAQALGVAGPGPNASMTSIGIGPGAAPAGVALVGSAAALVALLWALAAALAGRRRKSDILNRVSPSMSDHELSSTDLEVKAVMVVAAPHPSAVAELEGSNHASYGESKGAVFISKGKDSLTSYQMPTSSPPALTGLSPAASTVAGIPLGLPALPDSDLKPPILELLLFWAAELALGIASGLGLVLSGMTRPSKVAGFLTALPSIWDPSLAFVMAGAIMVTFPGFMLVKRLATGTIGGAEGADVPSAPSFPRGASLSVSSWEAGKGGGGGLGPRIRSVLMWFLSGGVDLRLVLGSLMFGCGWGLTGMCPGPIVVHLAHPNAQYAVLLAFFLAGQVFHDRVLEPLHQWQTSGAAGCG